ncbi:MAG: hypothetical protein ACR2PC_04520 [Tsuneonella suprasediminis]|nr:hypothetical protein LBX01_03310 [Altererythrobacter sp. N1]
MRRIAPTLLILAILPLLGGCLAKTALDVATAPVKIGSKAVDMATTSQSEADEKRGREIRKREERLGQLQREREKLERKCSGGNQRACSDLANVQHEIDLLMPQVPYEPDR